MSVLYLKEDMLIYYYLSNMHSVFNMACHIELQGFMDLDILETAIFEVFLGTKFLRSYYKSLKGQLICQICLYATSAQKLSKHTWN